MATYTLIPSSWAGDATITDPSNAYADTTSTTYAGVSGTVVTYAYLGGFDFSVIPQGYIVTGLTVKIKAQGNGTNTNAYLWSDVGGTALSSKEAVSSGSAQVYTFSLTESIDTILGYSSTLCIRIYSPASGSSSVYGAEINVEAVKPRNKIIYGNETLIDLTGDTATASDVLSGKTFHLASGLQATGTLPANGATVKKVTRELSVNGTSITFTGLSDEPKCFIVRVKDNVSFNSSTSNYKIVYVTYDGTNTTGAYLRGGTSTSTSGVIYNITKYSFTYSSGSLTVSSSGSSTSAGGGFIIGEWELIYAY